MSKNLFENNETINKKDFQINKDFEKKYNYNKKREEINKLKDKYGDVESSESSSDESIDDF